MVTKHFGYLDWLQDRRVLNYTVSDLKMGDEYSGPRLKRFFNSFSEDARIGQKHKINGVTTSQRAFVPAIAQKLLIDWLTQGKISCAVDESGLISVVLSAANGPPLVKWTVEKRDNLAILITFILRNALGDIMDQVNHDGVYEENGRMVVGALHLEPLPVEFLGRSSRSSKLLSKQYLDAFYNGKLEVRADPIVGLEPYSSNPITALAGRPVVKRDHLLSLTNNITPNWLAELETPKSHSAIGLALSALAGLFIGSQLSHTIFSNFGWLGYYVSKAPYILLAGVMFCWLLFWTLIQSGRFEENKIGGQSNFFGAFLVSLIVGALVSHPLPQNLSLHLHQFLQPYLPEFLLKCLHLGSEGSSNFSKGDSFLSIFMLTIFVGIIYWSYSRREYHLHRFIKDERLNNKGPEHKEKTLHQKSIDTIPILMCIIFPVIFLFIIPILSNFDNFDEIAFKPTDSKAVYFGHFFHSAIWVLPFISFGVLIQIWIKLGESESLVLLHSVVQRRMKQLEGKISQQKQIFEILPANMKNNANKNQPIKFDTEQAAKLLERAGATVKELQDSSRATFVGRAAVAGAAIFAILQFEQLKTFEPKTGKAILQAKQEINADKIAAAYGQHLKKRAGENWEILPKSQKGASSSKVNLNTAVGDYIDKLVSKEFTIPTHLLEPEVLLTKASGASPASKGESAASLDSKQSLRVTVMNGGATSPPGRVTIDGNIKMKSDGFKIQDFSSLSNALANIAMENKATRNALIEAVRELSKKEKSIQPHVTQQQLNVIYGTLFKFAEKLPTDPTFEELKSIKLELSELQMKLKNIAKLRAKIEVTNFVTPVTVGVENSVEGVQKTFSSHFQTHLYLDGKSTGDKLKFSKENAVLLPLFSDPEVKGSGGKAIVEKIDAYKFGLEKYNENMKKDPLLNKLITAIKHCVTGYSKDQKLVIDVQGFASVTWKDDSGGSTCSKTAKASNVCNHWLAEGRRIAVIKRISSMLKNEVGGKYVKFLGLDKKNLEYEDFHPPALPNIGDDASDAYLSKVPKRFKSYEEMNNELGNWVKTPHPPPPKSNMLTELFLRSALIKLGDGEDIVCKGATKQN